MWFLSELSQCLKKANFRFCNSAVEKKVFGKTIAFNLIFPDTSKSWCAWVRVFYVCVSVGVRVQNNTDSLSCSGSINVTASMSRNFIQRSKSLRMSWFWLQTAPAERQTQRTYVSLDKDHLLRRCHRGRYHLGNFSHTILQRQPLQTRWEKCTVIRNFVTYTLHVWGGNSKIDISTNALGFLF